MIKADYYKNKTQLKSLTTLTELVYEVLKRAFFFYEVWSVAKLALEDEKLTAHNLKPIPQSNIKNKKGNYSNEISTQKKIDLLKEPPFAIERLKIGRAHV